MSDLRQELRAGLDFTVTVEAAPVESLARRSHRRHRHRRFMMATPPIAAAVVLTALVLSVGHQQGTSVQVGGQPATATTTFPPVSSAAHSSGRFFAPIPSSPPVCSYPVPSDERLAPNPPLVAVDPDPEGVVAIWTPRLGTQPCQTTRTTGDAQVARDLAVAIMGAPAEPTGAFCAHDDGTHVTLYFVYPGRPEGHFIYPGPPEGELVQKSLTGCRDLSAPGVADRQGGSAALASLLAPITPTAFKNYAPSQPG